MRIYLDNAASTRMDEEVLNEMLPFFRDQYANPSGSSGFSAVVRKAVGKAREQVASLIGANADEIIFTSGGTESDNIAIFGAGFSRGETGHRKIITTGIEHPAVLNPVRELSKKGFEVLYAPCDVAGMADTSFFAEHTDKNTALVSVMTANNELGTIQDIAKIADKAHAAGALLFTDAVQAVGHIPVDVGAFKADLLSISSHKLHGPKGVGALYVRRGTDLSVYSFGGGQERGLRSGTLNVPGIVGLGKACEIASLNIEEVAERIRNLRNSFAKSILCGIPGSHINGIREDIGPDQGKCLPNILSVSFDGIEATSLLIELDMRGICCSTGSACSMISGKSSHVLKAAGFSEERIRGSVRFSMSKYTTREELDHTVEALKESVGRLRRIMDNC